MRPKAHIFIPLFIFDKSTIKHIYFSNDKNQQLTIFSLYEN